MKDRIILFTQRTSPLQKRNAFSPEKKNNKNLFIMTGWAMDLPTSNLEVGREFFRPEILFQFVVRPLAILYTSLQIIFELS